MTYIEAFWQLFTLPEMILLAIVLGMAVEGIMNQEKPAMQKKKIGTAHGEFISDTYEEFVAKHRAN